MTNLLIIETSARSSSFSTALAREFIEKLALNTVELNLKTRNLNSDKLQNLDEEMTIALRAGVKIPTKLQAKTIAQSDAMISELGAADIILIAAPMHNFTISAQLRTYIDYITRPGKTFGYTETGPKGLLVDRPVYIISTRGGQYGDGAPDKANPFDFQSSYLRHILSFIGLTSVKIIAANGMDMGDKPQAEGLASARTKIDTIVKAKVTELTA